MRAPDRYPRYEPIEPQPAHRLQAVTPTVYPVDDEVREGLLGPDGKPVNEGTKRKNPIGFHRESRPGRADP